MSRELFNSLVRAGTAGDTIGTIDSLKPEASRRRTDDGRRGAVLLVEGVSPSDVPRFAEPFFLEFNGGCRFRIVMSPEELAKVGLGELGKRCA